MKMLVIISGKNIFRYIEKGRKMNLLHEALTALLSGITTKTGEEIHWKDEYGRNITVELVDIKTGKYIIRYYYKNGQKDWQTEYQNDQAHGKHIVWYRNGQKQFEMEYSNGQMNGKYIEWQKNGGKVYEGEYKNGKLL